MSLGLSADEMVKPGRWLCGPRFLEGRIGKFLHQKEITWKFSPPSVSHMGRVWERQIWTIRKVLGAVLGQQILNDDSLSTLMCQVEAIINIRPITVISGIPNL